MNERRLTASCLALLVLLSAALMCRQLFTPGYFSQFVDDTLTYSSWAGQFANSLSEGNLYPRWMPLNFWGYGSPTFILYPPLAFYATSFFTALSCSLALSMNLVKFLSLTASAAAVFLLVRELHPARPAFLAAAFYLLFPPTVSDLYLAGGFPSAVSMVWLPATLLFLVRFLKHRRTRSLLLSGLCYGCFILTHLINAYMSLYLFIPLLTFLALRNRDRTLLLSAGLFLAVGLLVSAAYLLPLVVEMRHFTMEAFVDSAGGYDYRNFFLLPKKTADAPPGHFWPALYARYLFFTAAALLLNTLFLLHPSVERPAGESTLTRKLALFFPAYVYFAVVLQFGSSSFLWESLPFFSFIQYPKRWITVASVALALSSAGFFSSLERWRSPLMRGFVLASLFAFMAAIDLTYVLKAPSFGEEELVPVSGVNWALEHLPSGAQPLSLPLSKNGEERALLSGGRGEVTIVSWESEKRVLETFASAPSTLVVRTFYFPGWAASSQGLPLETFADPSSGAIGIDLPAGEHRVELVFRDTPVRRFSTVLSLATLLLLTASLLWPARSTPVPGESLPPPSTVR